MNKLIKNLKNDTYCRLKPDGFGGIGVFAIKDIPKGINPFKLSNGECVSYKLINVPIKVVKKLPSGVRKMVEAFYDYDEDTKSYTIIQPGLNAHDITFYMNTSDKPNIDIIESKKCTLLSFRTNKKIKSGQQLFINYEEY